MRIFVVFHWYGCLLFFMAVLSKFLELSIPAKICTRLGSNRSEEIRYDSARGKVEWCRNVKRYAFKCDFCTSTTMYDPKQQHVLQCTACNDFVNSMLRGDTVEDYRKIGDTIVWRTWKPEELGYRVDRVDTHLDTRLESSQQSLEDDNFWNKLNKSCAWCLR